jgi:hypothetical protein
MARCEYPNGNMVREDGTRYPIACDNPAEFCLQGWWFCPPHAGMVARGCLEGYYTSGETVREVMEKTALHRLLEQ